MREATGYQITVTPEVLGFLLGCYGLKSSNQRHNILMYRRIPIDENKQQDIEGEINKLVDYLRDETSHPYSFNIKNRIRWRNLLGADDG